VRPGRSRAAGEFGERHEERDDSVAPEDGDVAEEPDEEVGVGTEPPRGAGLTPTASSQAVTAEEQPVGRVLRILPLGSGLVLIGLGLGLAFLGLRLRASGRG
jgi:hypothetical protein